jgi:hypothetical protein
MEKPSVMTKPIVDSLPPNPGSLREQFRRHWQSSTDDNNLTLHGFRRFKTTHLLNLRFLEGEIAELDHTIYQAGLSLNLDPSAADRLGLKHSRRDGKVPNVDEAITREFVLKLRNLIKQYGMPFNQADVSKLTNRVKDDALAAFNNIMAMETFSLLDDEKHSSLRDDLTLHEIYKTRLVRVDLETRNRQDPFQRRLHKYLRAFRYWKLSRRAQNNSEGLGSFRSGHRWSYQNTVFIAEAVGRFVIAGITALFLVVPLAILSHESRKDIQLITVSICIVIFSFTVSILLKSSNVEMVVVSAAYAAILSVFVSNIP